MTYHEAKTIIRNAGMAIEDGLAFTVCGGRLVDGRPAPGWIVKLNGQDVMSAAQAIQARQEAATKAA